MKKEQYKSIAVAFVCLLLVISPFAMAEEIASVNNTKENLNASIDGSDEVEWQVVWQDETETASVQNGKPEWIWMVIVVGYWAYTAYDVYNSAKNRDYVAAIVSITPLGKVEKVEKVLKSATKLEEHHLLPQKYADKFKKAGLNVNDYIMKLPVDVHRLTPNGIHTNLGGNWNKAWDAFFTKYPKATKAQILAEKDRLIKEFNLYGYVQK